MSDLTESKCLVIMGKSGAGKDTLAKMINELVYGSGVQKLVPLKFSMPLKALCCDLFDWELHRTDDQAYKEDSLPEDEWLEGNEFGTAGSRKILRTRREVFCHVGTAFREMDAAVWVKAALRNATIHAPLADGFVSTDCRYPNEQTALVANFGKVRFVKLHKLPGNVTEIGSGHSSEDIGKLYTDMEFSVERGDYGRLREISRLLVYDFFPELMT